MQNSTGPGQLVADSTARKITHAIRRAVWSLLVLGLTFVGMPVFIGLAYERLNWLFKNFQQFLINMSVLPQIVPPVRDWMTFKLFLINALVTSWPVMLYTALLSQRLWFRSGIFKLLREGCSSGKYLGLGWLLGTISVGIMALVLWLSGLYQPLGWAWDPVRDLAQNCPQCLPLVVSRSGVELTWVFIFSVVSALGTAFVEELAFRGFLLKFVIDYLKKATQGASDWAPLLANKWLHILIALVVSSFCFSLGHITNNPELTPGLAMVLAGSAGVVFGLAYLTYKNLWLAIGLHFGWNWTMGWLGTSGITSRDAILLVTRAFGPADLVGYIQLMVLVGSLLILFAPKLKEKLGTRVQLIANHPAQ